MAIFFHPESKEGKQPIEPSVLWLRMPMRVWRVDPRWILRLRVVDLLPLARMVEATWEDVVARVSMSRRFPYDRCHLTVLVDRWRLETHMFHLLCGEMTLRFRMWAT